MCASFAATSDTFTAPTLGGNLHLDLCLRKGLILMTHLLWVVVSLHSEFSNMFSSLFFFLKVCCSTVPVNVFSVFAMLLCAVICGGGDWARDPAVGDKTHFNYGMEQQRTKSSLRQYCDVFLAEARLRQPLASGWRENNNIHFSYISY